MRNLENSEEASVPAVRLQDYWRIVVARRWWVLGPMFFCWFIVWSVSWIIPASYRSESLILVEQRKIPDQYVVPNVVTDLQGRLQSMTEQILSRTRLQSIIEKFDLYPKEQKELDSESLVEHMRRDIQIELVESQDKRELNAFRVSYRAPSPRLAQDVAHELTSLFINENLRSQQEESEMTTQFLARQVEEAKRSLVEQEAKMKDFKSRHLGELPSESQTNVQVLVGLQNRQQLLGEAVGRAEQEKLYLESLLNQYRLEQISSNKTEGMESPSDIRQDIAHVQQQLMNAEARYTPENPDVVALRAKLAKDLKLKDEIDKEYAAEAQKAEANSTDENPASPGVEATSPMMQLQSQLRSNNLQLQHLRKEVQDVQKQIGDYENRLRSAPVLEQQLAVVTRNYEQSQANHDALLRKQLESQLATNLEKAQEGQQFRVIDPPGFPKKPYLPNRQRLSFIGLGVGLALGLLAVVAMEIADGRIRGENELKNLCGPPVLADIPRLALSRREQQQMKRAFVAEACAASFLLATMIAGNVFTLIKG
jgi:polysaccharide chain length determinant protein (PEP-CTERM system associated)